MNGFDRVVGGEDNWFHGPRSLPLTPEEYVADLWCEVNALKNAISVPRQKVSNLVNALEQGKVSDKECAVLKRLEEKRGREATQVTELFNDWGGRGYDDSVPREVTKTARSRDRTT